LRIMTGKNGKDVVVKNPRPQRRGFLVRTHC
jgi:hypothetical protein